MYYHLLNFTLLFYSYSHFPSAEGAEVVMSSMGCYGSESSIFMCRNPGWKKNIDERCYEPNRNAGVFCYKNGAYHLYPKYSRLSLSRIPRDSLKNFEISVVRHIRFAELRKN